MSLNYVLIATEVSMHFSHLRENGRLPCSVVCVLSGVVSRWNLVVCGCPGDEIKGVPRGLCCVLTDSHSPLSHLTYWALAGVAAPSSHVLAGWSQLCSLVKTCTRGRYTITMVLSVTPLCMPTVWKIITAGRIQCLENCTQGKMFAECNTIRRHYFKVVV